MSNLGKVLMEKEILLESGTNELEILVFRVHDFHFAINVAKVREVLPRMRMAALPKACPAVKGVFQLRDRVIPCVSLAEHLRIEGDVPEQMMILTDFNQQQTAFLVHGVERIHRMSWQDVLPLPGLQDFSCTPVTALARRGNRLIAMLDFEMIHGCLTDHRNSSSTVPNHTGFPRDKAKVLVVDDSCTVREALRQTLAHSGYTQLRVFENGEEAWKWLEGEVKSQRPLAEIADLVVSDVEMPRVDGFHLTRRIKEHPQLSALPVLLYSSIVTPDNRKKGEAVGADAQLSKPELSRVVELADELIQTSRKKAAQDKSEAPPAANAAAKESARPAAPQPARPIATASPAVTPPQPTGKSTPPSKEAPPAKPAAATPAASKPSPANRARIEPLAPVPAPLEPAADTEPAEGAGMSLDGGPLCLFAVFRDELLERSAEFTMLLAEAEMRGVTAARTNQLRRSLHTIKSAAMVVPIDEVSRTTHLLESLIDASVAAADTWAWSSLESYADWLRQLTAEPKFTPDLLNRSVILQAEFVEEIAKYV